MFKSEFLRLIKSRGFVFLDDIREIILSISKDSSNCARINSAVLELSINSVILSSLSSISSIFVKGLLVLGSQIQFLLRKT